MRKISIFKCIHIKYFKNDKKKYNGYSKYLSKKESVASFYGLDSVVVS